MHIRQIKKCAWFIHYMENRALVVSALLHNQQLLWMKCKLSKIIWMKRCAFYNAHNQPRSGTRLLIRKNDKFTFFELMRFIWNAADIRKLLEQDRITLWKRVPLELEKEKWLNFEKLQYFPTVGLFISNLFVAFVC